jgi:hypothetical protein
VFSGFILPGCCCASAAAGESHRLFYTIEMEQRLVQLHTLLLSYVKNVHEADARLPRTAAGNTAQKII